jgi:hypothetical protein
MSISSINPGDWAVDKIEGVLRDAKRASYRKMKTQYGAHIQKHLDDASAIQNLPTETSNTIPPKPQGESKMSTHPITGAKVPTVPVKPRGAKPTPAGTKPKKK